MISEYDQMRLVLLHQADGQSDPFSFIVYCILYFHAVEIDVPRVLLT